MTTSKRKPVLVAYRRRATPEAMADVAGSVSADLRTWWYYCSGIAAGALLVAAGSTTRSAILTAIAMFAAVAAVSAWRLWWALRRLG